MFEPIPRTIGDPVKVGPMEALDWLLFILAILIPRMFTQFLENVTIFGFSWLNVLYILLGAGAIVILRLKSGKPRGYLWYLFTYTVRPNRYS